MSSTASTRRYDIDWLRVFATYLLLLFHTAMVFNPAPFYHIRNADVSFFFLILCGFVGLWHMPIFFLLAGWSAFSSLAGRGAGDFLRERFFRLFVPLIAGCLLLMPPIKFFELSNGFDANFTGLYIVPALQEGFRQVIPAGLPEALPFTESFLAFLPTFFTDLSRFTWSHLWFVVYLLMFTILYLPLFSLIRRSREWFHAPISVLWVYAPILALALVQLTMRERWPGLPNLIQDWANIAYYSIYLLCGFMLARFPVLEEAAHRERRRSLAVGLAATLVLLLGVLGVFSSPTLILAHTAIAGWCYVVAFLGWAHHKRSSTMPTLAYLTESAFPVYLLHQSAIVIPGYFLIGLPLGLWTKFALLLLVSTGLTVAVYHFAVRPFAVPRFLCGMKARASALPNAKPLVAGVTTASIALGITVALGTPSPSEALHASTNPIGRWYAEGGAAQVEISECGAELCGRVIWLRSPFDENGCELLDRYNPATGLRGRPVIGLPILAGLQRESETSPTWTGGSLYDPSSGNTYRASLTVIDEHRLRLRGYVGIPLLGRTTTWFRVGAEQEMCLQAG